MTPAVRAFVHALIQGFQTQIAAEVMGGGSIDADALAGCESRCRFAMMVRVGEIRLPDAVAEFA